MTFADLPAVNASLNALSGVFLALGLRFILRRNITAHRNCMVAACCTSLLFLTCYVIYHSWMQRTHGAPHTKFLEPKWFRPIYLTILFTHLAAAIIILPMIIVTLARALRRRFDIHKKIARW